MRGTPHTHNISIPSLGIIPAHAGNTLQICGPGCLAWDHPRACGEHITPNPFANAILGSSPRMRGTLACVPRLKVRTGIIPAHAGNTHGFVVSVPQVQDHPRACGEHATTAYAATHDLESSPRMRGTRVPAIARAYPHGIIPAHAGNTPVWGTLRIPTRDHPRACGEHSADMSSPPNNSGSSPRMRGTLFVRRGGCAVAGIIPAHAGNTIRVLVEILTPWDHPRACGEHVTQNNESLDVKGSSPRMRGTPW